jgi:uncharacterized protein YggE
MSFAVFQKPAVRWGSAAALVLAAFALVGAHRPVQAVAPSTTVVTVAGVATETLTPAQAVVDLGVTASDASAAGALATVAHRVAAVVQRLSAAGLVPAAAVRTGTVSLYPRYGPGAPGSPVGYQASETLRVTVSDVSRAGDLIDQAVAAGANQVDGLTFLPAHPRAVAAAAYRQALAEAAAQAEALAEDTHTRVLGLVSVDTTASAAPSPVFQSAAAAAPRLPVYPGTQQETVTVVARYRLGP